jgi:hypothetical protein
VLPPGQRQEGKPFILPPAERQEGAPFIVPEGEQPEAKPFIERQDQSSRRNRGADMELQPAIGWQAPPLQEPFPAGATPTPAQVIPAASQQAMMDQQPAPLVNVPPTPVPTAYPTAPAPQRPACEFPYVK